MTGSIAIDVVISLIFIYLLYSLFAAVILEIINTWLNVRGKNLKNVIYNMLNDDLHEPNDLQDSHLLSRFIKKTWRSIWSERGNLTGKKFTQKRGGLAKAFYATEGIQFMGRKNSRRSSPSNISAKQFSNGIVHMLTNDASNDQARAKLIRDFLNNEENVSSKMEINGDPSPGEASKSGINYLKFLFNDANGDVEKFKTRLEDWYEEMMLVATEWYKRRNQVWLFFIGLLLAGSFNLNTLHIVKILSLNNEARTQMVLMASAYMQNAEPKKLDSLRGDEKALLAYQKEIQKQAQEASSIMGLSSELPIKVKIDAVLKSKDFINLKSSREKQGKPIRSYLHFPHNNFYVVFEQPTELPYINIGKYVVPGYEKKEEGCLKLYSDAAENYQLKHDYLGFYLNRLLSFNAFKPVLGEKSEYKVGSYVYFDKGRYLWRYEIWGYLITALAISLGAPFWFDLLNKLMQLRGAVSLKNKSTSTSNQNNSNEGKG